MIATLLFAAVLQTQAPSDLLFSEAWGCAELAKMGRESHFGDTTPQTTGEQAMWDALTRLETLAREQAERKWTSLGYDPSRRQIEEDDARGMLGRATNDQLGEVLVRCAAVFGVEDPS